MGRRAGAFPGDSASAAVAAASSILSPRGSDSGGLGVKMVEYVLGTSPTLKEPSSAMAAALEPRMRALHLGGSGSGSAATNDDKDNGMKDGKPAQSPKEECNMNGSQQNSSATAAQNGQLQDDDKGFK